MPAEFDAERMEGAMPAEYDAQEREKEFDAGGKRCGDIENGRGE